MSSVTATGQFKKAKKLVAFFLVKTKIVWWEVYFVTWNRILKFYEQSMTMCLILAGLQGSASE